MLRKYWSYALCALKVYVTCASWHASGGIWPSLTHDLELKLELADAVFVCHDSAIFEQARMAFAAPNVPVRQSSSKLGSALTYSRPCGHC